MAELRSTENARCTITIRFVYEYATLYLLHAIPYVRMLRRVYDPKRVPPINPNPGTWGLLGPDACISIYLVW